VSGILGWIFFMVYDIDIHELNIGPFRDLKFLDEISLKKMCFLLVFRIAKGYHQDISLLRTIIFVIYHLFWWKVVHL